jgi:cyclopropane-fatty-acyl-phospholipid synthase
MATQLVLSDEKSIRNSVRVLEELTAGYCGKDFAVRFWDGTLWGNTRQPAFTLVLNRPEALRKMFLSASELALGEAYVNGDFDIEGDLEASFELADFLVQQERSATDKMRLAGLLMRLPAGGDGRSREAVELRGSLHSKQRDRQAVTYHYDLPRDFYALWLDKNMVYSCAYFRSKDDDLDTAQEQKLDYLCRKLRLRAGERLLDLGCGWGGLVVNAVKKFGAEALGITLSEPQAEVARERISAEGMQEPCKVEVRDYRDLNEQQAWDKIVSVGMFEHVGEELLPEYFRRAYALLRPGGVFLNHGIAVSALFKRKGPSFSDKYVFPDGALVPLGTTVRIAEACGFEVRDIESLREHYAMTLRHWVRRLETKAEQARNIVGEKIYRAWRLYMSGAAHGFTTGRLNLYQILFSKPDHGDSNLPLTREDFCS